MKPGSVTISPGSVSIPMVTGRVSRPSLGSTQMASQTVVIAPSTTYQTTAVPGTRVISSQATLPASAGYPGSVRTIVRSADASGSAAATPAVPAVTRTTIVRSTQAQPSVRLTSQAAPQVVRTIRSAAGSVVTGSAACGSAAPRAVAVPGPTYTQGTYEAKHQKDDPELKSLKDLRRTCGLKNVPVGDGLANLKSGAENGKLTRQQFLLCYEALLQTHEVEVPPEEVRTAVWELFDRDGNGVVDMMELVCGISLLCSGTEEEKIHAVFNVFDENSDGFISMDEMFKFLTSVFKVVLTPNVLGVMNTMGVNVQSAEDLASVTALECFKTADLNHDGRLSVGEFKNWFYTPRNDPTALFSPAQKLLP